MKTRRQQRTGRVVSDKMQKTIVVAVETLKRHPLYKRTYKSTAKFKAHDELNDARIGDLVRIEETRPLSKDKRWRLVEILNRAAQAPSVEQVVAELAPEVEG
jgi:small subunit ribosomal protein S17